MVGTFELADRDLKWRLPHQVRLQQENALTSLGETPEWNEWPDYHSRQSTFTSRDIRTQIDEYPCTFNDEAWNLYWWIPEARRLFQSKKYPPPCGCPEWRITQELGYVEIKFIEQSSSVHFSLWLGPKEKPPLGLQIEKNSLLFAGGLAWSTMQDNIPEHRNWSLATCAVPGAYQPRYLA